MPSGDPLPLTHQPTMPWRPRPRFSLASLLLAVTMLCVWLASTVDRARREKRGVERVEKLGGAVFFDYQKKPNPRLPPNVKAHGGYDHTAPPGPAWARRWLGEAYLSKPCCIRLWDVRLTEDDLRVIAGMRDLEEIGFYRVDLSAVSLEPLTKLRRLWFLALRECALGRDTLAPIGRLTSLDRLELTAMPLTDAQLPPLSDLVSLISLRITGTKLTGGGFGDLSKLSQFSMLFAAHTPFDDRGMKAIGTLPAAKGLDLKGTAITDRGVAHLAGMASLERLDLGRTALSDECLKHLSGLTALEVLSLAGARTEGRAAALDGLHRLSALKILWLDVVPGDETDAALARLRQALPKCQVVCEQREAAER